jgi:DNA invertase Pin-like site-specific DNA recombinase
MSNDSTPDRHLGFAAVAELLRRPAGNVAELAARLQERPRVVAAALRGPSIAPLVERRGGELRARMGATSATLPDRTRAELAGTPWGSRRPRLTVALYHRVSTVDQNPAAASAELRAAARRRGLRVVLDVRETGSGAANDRPGLVRVLDAARRGLVDVVMVWKLDRFGRSAFDVLGNVRQLEAAGVVFVCTSQGIEIQPGGDPVSRLMLTVLGAVAEFERDLIRERTRAGLAAARRAGRRIGRPPAARPEHAEVARLRKRGMAWPAIAELLGCSEWSARVTAGAVGAVKKGGQKRRSDSRRERAAGARL